MSSSSSACTIPLAEVRRGCNARYRMAGESNEDDRGYLSPRQDDCATRFHEAREKFATTLTHVYTSVTKPPLLPMATFFSACLRLRIVHVFPDTSEMSLLGLHNRGPPLRVHASFRDADREDREYRPARTPSENRRGIEGTRIKSRIVPEIAIPATEKRTSNVFSVPGLRSDTRLAMNYVISGSKIGSASDRRNTAGTRGTFHEM